MYHLLQLQFTPMNDHLTDQIQVFLQRESSTCIFLPILQRQRQKLLWLLFNPFITSSLKNILGFSCANTTGSFTLYADLPRAVMSLQPGYPASSSFWSPDRSPAEPRLEAGKKHRLWRPGPEFLLLVHDPCKVWGPNRIMREAPATSL